MRLPSHLGIVIRAKRGILVLACFVGTAAASKHKGPLRLRSGQALASLGMTSTVWKRLALRGDGDGSRRGTAQGSAGRREPLPHQILNLQPYVGVALALHVAGGKDVVEP